MPVPEASTYVDDCLRLGNYNVRLALKPFVTHPERQPAANCGQEVSASCPSRESSTSIRCVALEKFYPFIDYNIV